MRIRLSQLLKNENIEKDVFVDGIAMDSRKVKDNYLFFAVQGIKDDGTKYIDEAISKGAVVIITQKDVKRNDSIIIKVNNVRKIMPIISHKFYSNPSEKMEVIGITGTNGKTTTSYILKYFMDKMGKNAGVIGTVKHIIGGKALKANHTTPESLDIAKMMYDHLCKGGDTIAMEVSSHAIFMHRSDSIDFNGTVFTNLTRDHLDLHKDMNEYFNVKKRLFTDLSKSNTIKIINIDDEYGGKLYKQLKNDKNIFSFGKTSEATLSWEVEKLTMAGSAFFINYENKRYPIFLPLPAHHNIYNFAGAFLYMLKKGYDIKQLISYSRNIPHVKGRLETIEHEGRYFVVDYAHTPDALKNVLKGIREISHGRIITVFGAGGDRDKGKRPEMGYIADILSDIIIVTSDNPRNEEPISIIEDIKKGIKRTKDLFVIEDRKEAIIKSIKIAKEGDIVVIAGKGHEDYQILKEKTIHFSDTEIIKEVLNI